VLGSGVTERPLRNPSKRHTVRIYGVARTGANFAKELRVTHDVEPVAYGLLGATWE
jgi:hypothetical protein